MAKLSLGFNISATATGMAQGVNAAVVELEKLGLSAKKTAADVGVLKTLSIGRAFVDGISFIANTFSNYAGGVLEATESTSNLARELGISYNELTALQLAAQLSGVSAEELAKAFTRAQVTITNAANGGKEAAASLAAIGLSARDFEGLTSSQQFTLLAEAINGIADPAQRAAAAVAIFGKSGAALLPAFRELGENLQTSQALLAQFNGGVSQEQVNSVNAIGDAFDKVSAAIKIVATQSLAALSPALTQVSEEFIGFLASLDIASVAQTASAAIESLGAALQFAYSVASVLSPIAGALADFIRFIGDNSTGAAIGLAAATAALVAYQVASVAATVATVGLGVAIRGLLASTGIGAILVGFGLLAGAAIEWAVSSETSAARAGQATAEVQGHVADAAAEARRLGTEAAAAQQKAFMEAEEAAKRAAQEAKRAADSARRESDDAILRVRFDGDSQRITAFKATQAIEADILRTQQEIADARKAADQAAIEAGNARLAQLDQALSREQEIASGAAKAAAERVKLEQDYAEARLRFDEQRLAALSRPSTEALRFDDVGTTSGYSQLLEIGRQDPAVAESQKQTSELRQIKQKLDALKIPSVEIAG